MVATLVQNAAHSTAQGFVGVGLIALYFFLIVAVSFYRIKKGEHLDPH